MTNWTIGSLVTYALTNLGFGACLVLGLYYDIGWAYNAAWVYVVTGTIVSLGILVLVYKGHKDACDSVISAHSRRYIAEIDLTFDLLVMAFLIAFSEFAMYAVYMAHMAALHFSYMKATELILKAKEPNDGP